MERATSVAVNSSIGRQSAGDNCAGEEGMQIDHALPDVVSWETGSKSNSDRVLLASIALGDASAMRVLLSPAHREVIDLVYYHGMSINEVSEITGIPQNTVKTRMFYARNQMAQLLRRFVPDRVRPTATAVGRKSHPLLLKRSQRARFPPSLERGDTGSQS
jgi:Sigma-70, region 4